MFARNRRRVLLSVIVPVSLLFLLPDNGWAPPSVSWAPSYTSQEFGVTLSGITTEGFLTKPTPGLVKTPQILLNKGFTDVRLEDALVLEPLGDGSLAITVKRTGERRVFSPPAKP